MIKLVISPQNRIAEQSIRNISENLRRGIRQAYYKSGKKIAEDLKKDIMRKPRYGQTYYYRTSGGQRRRHIASVPGEAPANWTGALKKSIWFKVKNWHYLEMGYSAYYGQYLELGTERMGARPGWKINIKKNDRNIQSFIDNEIHRSMQ